MNRTLKILSVLVLSAVVGVGLFMWWKSDVDFCLQSQTYYNNVTILKGNFDRSCTADFDCVKLSSKCVSNNKENADTLAYGQYLSKHCAAINNLCDNLNEFIRRITKRPSPLGGTDAPFICLCENNECVGATSFKDAMCTQPRLEDCDRQKVKITGTVMGSKGGYYLCDIENRKVEYGWFFPEKCIAIDDGKAANLSGANGKKIEIMGTITASDGKKCNENKEYPEQCAGEYHITGIQTEYWTLLPEKITP
ncbi:MAG: hypothetical protein WA093_05040 [Minisyncoccales bacterium]|jgi:hypothetical protein